MRSLSLALVAALGGAVLAAGIAEAYPIYGSEETGIRRLEEARLANDGEIKGKKRVAGETLRLDQVDLRLLDRPDMDLPAPDPDFSKRVRALLPGNHSRYGIAVLDLSDPANPRYAEHNGDYIQNVGSVGKIIVATAVFQALADTYPNDLDKRMAVLRDSMVTADEFIIRDSHTVRLWDPQARKLTRRPLQIGDRGSLFEWLDWMMSPSSNAAAATNQKHAMLINHYGTAYPVSHQEGMAFFKNTPKQELGALFARSMQDPLSRSGLDLERFRQGSFFTRTGKSKVPGTSSYGTAREMMRYLMRMEQGKLVDEFSSRETKRLLYMTERRIRYASSPALRDAAVYFKSGSLYACEPEPGFKCKKYHGNKRNFMNSIAIVEWPAVDPKLFYIVTLISNVLKKNSAVDHQTLGTRIHRMLQKDHGVAETQ